MIKREPFFSQFIPFRIGCVVDWPFAAAVRDELIDVLRFCLDEATATKRLNRPVELLVRSVDGAPRGEALAAAAAWQALAQEEQVQLILGPHSDEAALAVAERMRERPHPTVSACNGSHFSSDFGFTLDAGNAADEASLLARLHAQRGHRVGVLHEASPAGAEAYAGFCLHARELGVPPLADAQLPAACAVEEALAALRRLQACGVDAVQIFAGACSLPALAQAAAALQPAGFRPQYVMGSGYAGRHALENFDAASLDGWIGIELHSAANATATAFLDRYQAARGRRPQHAYALLVHDLAQVAIQALATAKPHNPVAIKQALERLRFWPAAIGAAGNIISFASHDHRAYKGTARLLSGGITLPDEPPAARAAAPVIRSARAPYRIGVIQDWMLGTEAWFDQFDMTRFAFMEAYESGLIDRPVELVVRELEGPLWGHTEPVIDAWKELATRERCLAIIGPHITDDTRSARATVEAHRVPTLTYCATLHAAGDYFFQLPNGTFADETGYIARHLASRGAKKVGIIREDNIISDEYNEFLRMYCKRLGISVASDQVIHSFADADEVVSRLGMIRESGADSIAYLAFGATAYNVLVKGNEALKRWNWDPPKVTITTWVGVTCPGFKYFPIDMSDPKHHPLLEGWIGVDQTHEDNLHWTAVRERFAQRFAGRKPFHCYASLGYDMANCLAVALSRATEKTPEGIRRALETIRLLPAVSGGPGTSISFGPHDRRGLKGPDYLVLRTVRDGREMLA